MSPEEQLAKSRKYISSQFCFVAQPDGRLSAFYAYGPHRTYIGEFTTEELFTFLHEDYKKKFSLNETRLRQEELIREQSKPVKLDIDFQI